MVLQKTIHARRYNARVDNFNFTDPCIYCGTIQIERKRLIGTSYPICQKCSDKLDDICKVFPGKRSRHFL